MNSAVPLAGRRALVTGSRNLGAEIARQLAAAGAQVAVTFHTSDSRASALTESLPPNALGDHVAVRGDLTSAGGGRAVVESAARALGGVDVLVNNFGPWAGAPYQELAEEEWDLAMAGNVRSAYTTTQAVAPHMRQQGWGRVVNISAGSAFVLDHSVYGLAKHSLLFLTAQLAVDLGPSITVNAIAPGQIAESAPEMEEVEPGSVERMLSRSPGGRLVTRAEVAGMVVVLCSPVFDTVTGATIPMDAGWRLPRA